MAYITKAYFDEFFPENDISENDFNALAEVASTLIFSVCCCEPKGHTLLMAKFKQAVAWQTRFLYEQGGINAALGQSDASYAGGSESLGDYSVSGSGTSGNEKTAMLNGIPVCGFSLVLLEQLGLMSRLVRKHRCQKT